ncbi:TRAP transporter small permease [Nitratireductor pacificus]|uniref:TRAP transporter small permease protein n=1 Tax=Nitratireductor pacificus pht-3B TaxID=391937 RepID=K2MDC5_9HYPH|nr:TRAP transporter small permease [Nitratireductor pacificus]EKF20161.1 tripartite AtP-independent periplasmic transporter subunit DctQ [Nitratireductor pacificus pht-3B]
MINRILEAICAALLLATVVIGFLAVIYRYVFDNALSWSFEALLGLLTYITFIGAYLALRKNAHLRVDFLTNVLPRPGQLVLFLGNQAVIGLIGLLMLRQGWRQTVLFQDQTTQVLEISNAYLYAAIPLCGLLICIDAATRIVVGLRRYAAGEAPHDEAPLSGKNEI